MTLLKVNFSQVKILIIMKNMTTIPSIIFFIQNKKGYFLPEQKRHEVKDLTIPKNIHKKNLIKSIRLKI